MLEFGGHSSRGKKIREVPAVARIRLGVYASLAGKGSGKYDHVLSSWRRPTLVGLSTAEKARPQAQTCPDGASSMTGEGDKWEPGLVLMPAQKRRRKDAALFDEAHVRRAPLTSVAIAPSKEANAERYFWTIPLRTLSAVCRPRCLGKRRGPKQRIKWLRNESPVLCKTLQQSLG